MDLGILKAGFVGFGEVNSPRELIERKCSMAQRALTEQGITLLSTAPVSDDPEGRDEERARKDLASGDFDVLLM